MIGGFRRSFFVYLGDIWCFLCCLYTALFPKDGQKATTKEGLFEGGETDLIKMGDMRRIGKYKIPRVYERWACVGGSSF